MRLRLTALIPIFLIPILCFGQQNPAPDAVLDTLKSELNRSFTALKSEKVAPYFISYQLTDNRAVQVSSNFGALTGSSDTRSRLLDLDLRVGDYKLDNTHRGMGMAGGARFGQFTSAIPIEDGSQPLSVALWLETDRHYKSAVQSLDAIKTNKEIKVDEEDKSPDFSAAPAEKYSESLATITFERTAWEDKVRGYGRGFREFPDLLTAYVNASAEAETRRYVNTDGAEIRTSMPFYRIMIDASVRADDGEILNLHRDFMSFSPDSLPTDEQVKKTVAEMGSTLMALRKAPVAEPYTGPAILSGRASAVFFHEIFGHRVEGARLKDDDDAQTFKKKIDQLILPKFLSVYSDPTLRKFGNTDLVGYYPFDDEGVKARRVTVVDKGLFKTFLMSRSPVDRFLESNGHGRRQQGHMVAARQSNLIVDASKTVSRAELKKQLIDKVKAAKKPYGLFFDDIQGGFTFTSRQMPNSFSVNPTLVYRIYTDGREELVRGLDLIGTPLIAFSKISSADNEPQVFNGVCGAESGWVPVSATAPGLLLDQIEVQRKDKSEDRKPVLPAPTAEGK